MTFSSHEFIFLFLPGTFIVYHLLARRGLSTASTVWLIICSFAFCCWNEITSGLVLACSIVFTYYVGRIMISRPPGGTKGKAFLALGVGVTLASLCYYKYTGFILENLNHLFGWRIPVNNIPLPLGISFFTFTEIAYLVDLYRNPARGSRFLDFTLFVSFFPRFLAGPITRFDYFARHLGDLKDRSTNYHNLSLALVLFCVGLFKKVVMADHLAEWANRGFDGQGPLNLLLAWATSLSYTLQIYFDFSGYTDMAIGAALFFNIRLPINFNSPYKAVNIQDFWRRWHITLTSFLRDYIYIPLGGNRVGQIRLYGNMMTVFLIGGLWHGAGWTFLIWGFLHGTGLVIHQLWKKTRLRLPRAVGWFVTFNFVNMAWVFFRARDWDDAMKVLKGMFGCNGVTLPAALAGYFGRLGEHGARFESWKVIMEGQTDSWIFIFAALMVCLFLKNSNFMAENFRPHWKWLLVLTAGVYAMLSMSSMNEFVYQFF